MHGESEISIVKELQKILNQKKEQENKPYWLKKAYSHVNLASKNFQGIWSGWWKSKTPPKLEVDMIFVFEDIGNILDNALMVATEVKFFQEDTKRNFFEGLQQVMAFSLFGFDGLALWHIFSEKIDDSVINSYAQAMQEIIRGYELPIFYLATKLSNEFIFKIFEPAQIEKQEIDYLIAWIGNFCNDENNRNPLLFHDLPLGPHPEEIKKRRNTLKVLLKIPV